MSRLKTQIQYNLFIPIISQPDDAPPTCSQACSRFRQSPDPDHLSSSQPAAFMPIQRRESAQTDPAAGLSVIDEYRHTAMADDFLGLAALQQQTEATPTM